MIKNKISLEVQYFKGCPHSAEFIESIKKIIEEDNNKNYEYTETLVISNEQAKELRFRGSPTLLINGNDLEDLEAPENPGLNCRYYPDGLPNAEKIKKKLEKLKFS